MVRQRRTDRVRQRLLRPPRRAVEVQPELGRERRRQVLRRRHAVVRRAAPDLVTGRSPTGANVVVATFSLSPTSQSTRPETAGFFVACGLDALSAVLNASGEYSAFC